MAKQSPTPQDDVVVLLKHLLAIELWRAGLSQAQIRSRLGLGMNVVNEMLKGVKRHIDTQHRPE
jgi:predicted transcriptional regulator